MVEILTLTARWRRLPDRAIGNADSRGQDAHGQRGERSGVSPMVRLDHRVEPTLRVRLAHGQRQHDRPDLIVDGSVGTRPQRHGLTADQLEAWDELTAGHQQLP